MELFRSVYFDGGKPHTEKLVRIGRKFIEKLDNYGGCGPPPSKQQGGSKHQSTISSHLLFSFNH